MGRPPRLGFARVRVDGKSVSLDDPPKLSHRRKHRVEVVDRPRHHAALNPLAAGRLGRVRARPGQGGRARRKGGRQAKEERWPVDRYSQHRSCDGCGRSFEELSPHHFSFNSPLGWCPVCEGLGTQHGANPAVLVPDGKRSLRKGAVAVWPDFDANPAFARIIAALARRRGSTWTPFDELEGRHRRAILHGTGDAWFAVPAPTARPRFSFQYKGLFPAIEEAARVSFVYRYKLQGMVDDVPCASCMGARLRDDSAAVRFRELHDRPGRPLAPRPGATRSSRA